MILEMLGDHLETIKLHEQQRQSLENEIKSLMDVIQQQKKSLSEMKLERDRNATHSQAKASRIDATQSELSIKIKLIADLTWELEKTQTKLSHVQQQLDSAKAERDALEKNIETITDDRNEVRDKLRVSDSIQKFLCSLSTSFSVNYIHMLLFVGSYFQYPGGDW